MGKGLSHLTKHERIDFNRDLGILYVLAGFLIICYLTAGIMTIRTGEDFSQVASAKGGLYGPFTIIEDKTSAMITIKRTASMKSFDWDSLDVEILDKDKGYMSSFGAEFWKETGRDSDSSWTATQYDAEFAYFFHQKGDYYLKVTTSSNKQRNSDSLFAIKVRQQLGSSEMFLSIGFWMLWITGFWCVWVFRFFEEEDS